MQYSRRTPAPLFANNPHTSVLLYFSVKQKEVGVSYKSSSIFHSIHLKTYIVTFSDILTDLIKQIIEAVQ